MIEINPQRIRGRWLDGYALDFHTISSTPIGENVYGHMQFDTVRPPVAELLYKLKYRGDVTVIEEIAAVAADFLKRQLRPIDLIVPAPPSAARRVQPVVLLAESIGALLKIPVAGCVTTTRPSSQLKDITDPAERTEALAGLYAVDVRRTRRKAILLFDDLYRSGSTLNAITSLLLEDGLAAQVNVLTITRTRSNR
jgi:predicted amidophosphoribosyltransferase